MRLRNIQKFAPEVRGRLNYKTNTTMVKRFITKISALVTFRIGVNVIGIPETKTHEVKSCVKERNVRQRYSYSNK